jgi:hypothetical protein
MGRPDFLGAVTLALAACLEKTFGGWKMWAAV